MKPGPPIPMPASSAVPCRSRSADIAATISAKTASRPSEKFVLPPIFSSSLPVLSIAAARRLVPPKSTPIEYPVIGKRMITWVAPSSHLAAHPHYCQRFDNSRAWRQLKHLWLSCVDYLHIIKKKL